MRLGRHPNPVHHRPALHTLPFFQCILFTPSGMLRQTFPLGHCLAPDFPIGVRPAGHIRKSCDKPSSIRPPHQMMLFKRSISKSACRCDLYGLPRKQESDLRHGQRDPKERAHVAKSGVGAQTQVVDGRQRVVRCRCWCRTIGRRKKRPVECGPFQWRWNAGFGDEEAKKDVGDDIKVEGEWSSGFNCGRWGFTALGLDVPFLPVVVGKVYFARGLSSSPPQGCRW